MTNTIFGRWELPVADDVYIRNGSGNNIGMTSILKKVIGPFDFNTMN